MEEIAELSLLSACSQTLATKMYSGTGPFTSRTDYDITTDLGSK